MATKNVLKFKPGCNAEPEEIRKNIRVNIERDLPWLALEDDSEYAIQPIALEDDSEYAIQPIAIVCGGPSLERYWHSLKNFEGQILACNGAYRFLIEHKIVPDYFMLLDSRPENISFLDFSEPMRDTIYFLAAQCDPDIFDYLEKDPDIVVGLYLTTIPGITELTKHIDKPKNLLGGAVGTVGVKAMSLAYTLGYRDMHLYGYDSSYADGEHHAYPQPINDGATKIEVFVEDRKYITSPTLAHQAQEFPGWAENLAQAGCDIHLYCDGLLLDLVRHCAKEAEKPLEDREREKYEKMWGFEQYRKDSPGEKLVDMAVEELGIQRGASILDFGCGTGRALAKFRNEYGVFGTGIDFAKNCIDTDVDIDFYQQCLWSENIQCPRVDWGYCTDVMEHIPPEKVKDVLYNISLHTKRGCFFNIATRDDNLGALIGRKLHMTVMSAEHWRKLLHEYFPFVKMVQKTEGEAVFICRQRRAGEASCV